VIVREEWKLVKVLGIMCSPRKGGNTEILLEEALSGDREHGAETETVDVLIFSGA